MASNKRMPRNLARSFQRLSSDGTGNLSSILAAAMGNPAFNGYWDDFQGSDASTWPASANWMYPATVGTGTESITIVAAQNGTLRTQTGTNSGDGAYQYLGLNWVANSGGIYYIIRAKLSSAATNKFEVGLTDSLTNEGVVATEATPTFTATDGVVFVFDTSNDTHLHFISCKAGVVAANVDTGIVVDANFHVYEIYVGPNGSVEGYVDGQNIGGNAAGLTATAPLTPGFGDTTRTTSAKSLTVDYQGCWSPRGTSLTA